MSVKQSFIKLTNREGLAYKTVDLGIFNLLKYYYALRFGHLIRHQQINQYLKTHRDRKVHFGSGLTRLPGFLNSDIHGQVPIDITKRLPFSSHSINLIFSYHLVEHIYKRQFISFLREVKRVLHPNGLMIAGTPSLAKVTRALYCDDPPADRHFMLNYHRKFSRDTIVTSADYFNDLVHLCFGHKYIYDLELMKFLGSQTGFSSVESLERAQISDQTIQSSLPPLSHFRDRQSEIFVFRP